MRNIGGIAALTVGLILVFFLMTVLGVPGFIMEFIGGAAGKIPFVGGAIEAITAFDKETLGYTFGDSVKAAEIILIHNLSKNILSAFVLGIISAFVSRIAGLFWHVTGFSDVLLSIAVTAVSVAILSFYNLWGDAVYAMLSSVTGIIILVIGIVILAGGFRWIPRIQIGGFLLDILINGLSSFLCVFFFTNFFMLPPVIRSTLRNHGSITLILGYLAAVFLAWIFVVLISAIKNDMERTHWENTARWTL